MKTLNIILHAFHIFSFPICTKLGAGDDLNNLLSICEFRKNWRGERHTLLLGLNEFVPQIQTVFVRFLCN